MSDPKQRCRYVEGYGYYLPSHLPTCTDRSCGGCQPCERDGAGNPTSHCLARKTCTGHLDHAHPLTCPKCIGKTREDLASIGKAHGLMLEEALSAGVDSEAADLAGPAADPEAWSWHKSTAKDQGRDMYEEDDPRHPVSVLGAWDFMLREDYEQPTTLRVTVGRTIAYLDGLLGRFAQDGEQDWPLFVSEVRACRSHLEAVLHDSRVPEQGAPCPTCVKGPRLVKHYTDHDLTGASDVWRCPADRDHQWSEADYRMRIGAEYLDHADTLTATQIHERYDVKPGALRKRVERGSVKRRGKNHLGQQLYDVESFKADEADEDVA